MNNEEKLTTEELLLSVLDILLMRFFDKDREKVDIWWKSPNPMFGEITPKQMLQLGRLSIVVNMIVDSTLDQVAAEKAKNEKNQSRQS